MSAENQPAVPTRVKAPIGRLVRHKWGKLATQSSVTLGLLTYLMKDQEININSQNCQDATIYNKNKYKEANTDAGGL